MEGGLNSYAGRPKTQILGALDMKILGHPDVGSTQDDQTLEWPSLGCDYFTIITSTFTIPYTYLDIFTIFLESWHKISSN